IIKKFRNRPEFVLPDRAQVTMTVPFMRSYTELLVKTCHRRGAHALGGMAAFIPSRRDPEVNRVALAKVKEDKDREANDGFDGTWVAHPDLVPTATEAFDRVLGHRPNQLERQRPEVDVKAGQLTDVKVPGGTITENGLRMNVSVGIQYIESWMRGTGAAAINNLMEDVATAEISRSQVWQWAKHASRLAEGPTPLLGLPGTNATADGFTMQLSLRTTLRSPPSWCSITTVRSRTALTRTCFPFTIALKPPLTSWFRGGTMLASETSSTVLLM